MWQFTISAQEERAHILEYYLYSHQASYYVRKSENLKGELEKLEPCAR
jgi:hypothetical protein